MKFLLTFLALMCASMSYLVAQDTFSIVAADPETGEVGSAGATCLDDSDIAGGAVIISKLYPGKGAVNTQSYYEPQNQNNAGTQLKDGKNAQEIIDWLELNDIGNNPSIRQYGVLTIDSENLIETSAFTGVNCFDVKNHIIGENYAIQGNILLNEEVLTEMEENFLNTEGSLANKLMSALQGANIPGADSRCLSAGLSSKSSFLRVAKKDDDENDIYLDLIVSKTNDNLDPIDSLQNLFDQWSLINETADLAVGNDFYIYPNPIQSEFTAIYKRYNKKNKYLLEIRDPSGKLTQVSELTGEKTRIQLIKSKIPQGQYIYSLKENGIILKQSSFIVINE